MSSIIVKQYNGTSYTGLTPKESINSDTVDNYHASDLITSITNQNINYTDVLVRKLYNGDSVNIPSSTVFTFTQMETGKWCPYSVRDGWVTTFDLFSLNDKKLIKLSSFQLTNGAYNQFKRYVAIGNVYVTLNSKKVLNSTGITLSDYNFRSPEILLVDLFGQVVTKNDTLTVSFEVTGLTTYSTTFYYISSSPNNPYTANGKGMVLK